MKSICIGPECTRDAIVKGMCFSHYKQVHFDGRELTKLNPRMNRIDFPEHCTGPECTRKVEYAGLCHSHLRQKYKKRTLVPLRPYNRVKNEQEGP